MKHASDRTLDGIEPLLRKIRATAGLVERKRGVWYMKARAFLHFHEDPAGVFADLREGADFERLRVSTARERAAFLRRLRKALHDLQSPPASERP